VWFNHGISHGIGLERARSGAEGVSTGHGDHRGAGHLHPAGCARQPAEDAENEQFIAAVKAGFEKYKGIGVRIEDDVLITRGETQGAVGRHPL
jgi:Xaa-Pro aminopeptidase